MDTTQCLPRLATVRLVTVLERSELSFQACSILHAHCRVARCHRSELSVSHADGTAYGLMASPLLADARARAFAGLRNLVFSEKAARASLEHALANAPANATVEMLLRSAVARAS